ncbi:porin family protein [Shewanella sp. 10N.7]|uniref:outer membrane beta-barrel protein n=1 Tax=Shewanella sp. 10N.7 TaxID=2885093 RepID=UPI001E58EB11|nr:outer membrane beta-barrel protein [Shewanella sp. 10N.7]MCC4834942.1 porin family protein [Shewanella sp. 10N.7]
MNKLYKALLVAGVTISGTTAATAADVEYFVGAATGYQTDTIKGDIRKDSEDMSWQLRAGVLINEQHRITGTFGYMEDKFNIADTKYKQEQYSWLVSYDYLVPMNKNANFFIGLTAGANDNKVAGKASTDFVYGGQAGLQYKWNEHLSSDLGYRYLEQDYSKNGINIENSQQVYLTLDYTF